MLRTVVGWGSAHIQHIFMTSLSVATSHCGFIHPALRQDCGNIATKFADTNDKKIPQNADTKVVTQRHQNQNFQSPIIQCIIYFYLGPLGFLMLFE